ncbi:hypothetical protein ACFRJ9_15435 [Paenarthrobacter sp. NPDC056912]|uniref:hypothetical protein n=1 Tax=Paenarthrobacter sp. NPDC056912 TaxID=3345965 RepID=UPI00366AA61F
MDYVHFTHDFPRLFSARSAGAADRSYLVFCVEEDEVADTVTFMYVPLSPEHLLLAESGGIQLSDIFTMGLAPHVWIVETDFAPEVPSDTFQYTDVADIPSWWIPLQGAKLRRKVETATAFNEVELISDSRAGLRSVVALEFEAATTNVTEFPLRSLGKVSEDVQDLLTALAQEERGAATERGAVPRSISEEVEMSVYGLRAASFVLLIGANKRERLIEHSPLVEASLDRLTELVDSATSESRLIEALGAYRGRVRSRFRDLLGSLAEAQSPITTLRPSGARVDRRHLGLDEIADAIRIMDQVEPQISKRSIPRASLVGLNLTTSRFELIDLADLTTYAGQISPAAAEAVENSVVGHATDYHVELTVETSFVAASSDAREKFILKSITPKWQKK